MGLKQHLTRLDQQIRKAIRNGEMGDWPGAGQPLNMDGDRYTPSEMRLAHKILRDNNLAPEWIMQGKALDEACEKWLDHLRHDVLLYQRQRNADAMSRFRAETQWHSTLERHHRIAEELNKQITAYNLKIPSGVKQKPHLNLDHEIAQIQNEITD